MSYDVRPRVAHPGYIFFFFLINSFVTFIWVHQVLVATLGVFIGSCGIFSCGAQTL